MLDLALALALAPATCDAVVSGRVADAATGEPIPQARIASGGRSAVTGDDGTFRLGGICPGTRSIRASRADYQPRSQDVAVTADGGRAEFALEPHAVETLDDVVVVAPDVARADVAATDTLDEEALDQVRGRGLADALASISGVTVLRSPAGGMGKPIIRGHVGRRNLILYDRVRHEAQKWGIDHAPELDPFAADSITVIKGAGGIRYGPDAIGGVVLIDPPPLPTTPGVSGETHFIGVSNGLQGTTATRVQGAHAKLPGFAWRAEANASRGAAKVTPQYPLDNTGSAIWNAGATLGYQRRGFSLRTSYRHHDARLGLFTGLRNETQEDFVAGLSLDRPIDADLYQRDYAIERAYQRTTHDLVLVRGRAPLRRAGAFVATYAYQDNERDEFDTVRAAVTGPQLEFDLLTHTGELAFEQAPVGVGARAVLEGSVGGLYMHQRNAFDGADPSFLPDYVQDSGGVFVIERFAWERFELEGGARYDGMRRVSELDDRAYLPFEAQGRLPSGCERTADGGTCPTTFHAPSGSVGALVRPVRRAPGFVLKADALTAARFPATDEQFIKGSAPAFPVFSNGNGRLGTERTWGGGLSVAFANEWVWAEGAAYGNFIDDYIYFRADPQTAAQSDCAPLTCGVQGAFPLFEPTAVDAVFYGGEVAGKVQPPKWPVAFEAQGSWVRAQQVRSGTPLVFIPPDRYRLGVTYFWPDFGGTQNGFVTVGGTVVDRQRRFDVAADFAVPPPAYGLLHAGLGIEVPFAGQRFKAALHGSNLTNTRYRDYTSLLRYFANEPGWELMLRLTLEFDL